MRYQLVSQGGGGMEIIKKSFLIKIQEFQFFYFKIQLRIELSTPATWNQVVGVNPQKWI